jgi:hypothetical protein
VAFFILGANKLDRKIVYPGAIPLETDLLSTNKFAMIGLAKLAAAVLGTNTAVNGFTCIPTTPASTNVTLTPGEIYSMASVDGTAYSSLAADTTHQILKQGILMDPVVLGCPAPPTSGFSINYLIEVAYSDSDTNATVLPYYNASNPSQAFSGANNSGNAQNTVRQGAVSFSAKAGIAAATGSQTTPAPDPGYVGLFVVSVAYGQTAINSAAITQYPGAPFVTPTTGLAPLNSPSFTGTPLVPTPVQGANNNQIANTAFIQALLAAFAQLNSPTFTGTPTAPNVPTATNNNQIATTNFARSLINALFTGSYSSSGYMNLNGLIIQWGQAVGPSASGSTSTFTFPTTFPNNVFNIQLTIIGALGLTGDNGPVTVQSYTNSSCTVYSSNDPGPIANMFYFIIGN